MTFKFMSIEIISKNANQVLKTAITTDAFQDIVGINTCNLNIKQEFITPVFVQFEPVLSRTDLQYQNRTKF